MFAKYTCGRCGGSVSKTTQVCPHCGAQLAGIKCQNCGFVGSRNDFVDDYCPKCGSYQEDVDSVSIEKVGIGAVIGIGIIVLVAAVVILAACTIITILLLLGPVVGNVFSNIVENLEITPTPY